jgi:hypothetical protein
MAPAPARRRFPEFALVRMPAWALVRQELGGEGIADVAAAVGAAIGPSLALLAPGSRVCLAVGSRGIDRILAVVQAVVADVRRAGMDAFVIPAMGSHGGATAEGQLEVLASYGITPESIACEIRASMETIILGELEPGVPIRVDREAIRGADHIIPINRVKPHTDFSGPVGSGLLKMIAIGLGKRHGADALHGQGFGRFEQLIPAVVSFTLLHAPIPFGIALVENALGAWHGWRPWRLR